MPDKYISFGPITNKDGSLTEFTKQFFGLSDKQADQKVMEARYREATFSEIRKGLKRIGMIFEASVPDREGHFIIIAYLPTSGHFSTHATEHGNESLCWGHYDFPTFEAARVDALERALHR